MNYVFQLTGEIVDGQRACCLGSQLARIVNLLAKCLGEVVWYSADVDAVGEGFPAPSQILQPIGRSPRLVELAKNIKQFLRGVFFAVDVKILNSEFRNDIDTEDAVDAELGDAVVEIRTFDTTYFEIHTRDRQIAECVMRTFSVKPLGPIITAHL